MTNRELKYRRAVPTFILAKKRENSVALELQKSMQTEFDTLGIKSEHEFIEFMDVALKETRREIRT